MRSYNIKILIKHSPFLQSFSQAWNSNDLKLTFGHNNLEQIEFSAYSLHIEKLVSKEKLFTRIISLNLLLNGSLFIESGDISQKINFYNFNTTNEVEDDTYSGYWTDRLEDYPFIESEEYWQEEDKLPKKDIFSSMLFSLSKRDSTIRNLLFHTGLLSTSSINDSFLAWSTLYKMVDIIKVKTKEYDIELNTLINLKALSSFTMSCNNPLIIGLASRHGKGDKNQTVNNKITNIDQAIELILCFTKKFLQQYTIKQKYISINNLSSDVCVLEKTLKEKNEDEMKKLFY